MDMTKQLTDDGVRHIIFEIVNYIDLHPLVCSPVEGEAYDRLSEFIEDLLDPYSDGYMNCN